ncbi:hypothetical protein QWM81_28805 [Streptomyces ficellus]|uniref:Uncharacterized protein n=1 Tax=Streptomyces ficellus TaxID=1977088 RepID=A0ABT7ZEL7_9ACTN|nr:hypothetical protein [Streptomyces ficellus]MDN3297964.1 hypothetical protein [Streptomyces ficellus]
MNRRLSMALAVYGAWNQAILLFLFDPIRQWVIGALAPGATIRDVRVLGLSLDGFAVRDLHHVEGWLPQLVFTVLSGILTYGVFRGAPGLKPRLRTVLALNGAVLLAAGVATLIGPALDPDAGSAVPTYDEWLMNARLGAVPAAAAQFALCTVWLLVAVWLLVWRCRRWQPLREHLGTSEGAESDEVPVPLLAAARERRDLVCAGLIPAVLLAVAGGPLLRHTGVRQLAQTTSLTFDPDLWVSYRPSAQVNEWSGVLYPALRLRPVSTERISGWLATLAICVVFLVALAVALRSVARRVTEVSRRRPVALMRLVMEGWYATLLAAVAAAVVDGRLLQWFAPRAAATTSAQPLGIALDDAVRFGSAWGWATGLACVAAVLLMMRRGARAAPGADLDEERLSDAS